MCLHFPFKAECAYLPTRQATYIYRNIDACSFNYWCSRIAIIITSECVCLMPYLPSVKCSCAILSYVASPLWLYYIFPHYLIHDMILEKLCFDILYNFHLKHFSFWEELSVMWSKKYIDLQVKYETCIFSTDFRKKLIYSFINILWLGAESFHANRWTDMMKLIVTFSNFVRAPKNLTCQSIVVKFRIGDCKMLKATMCRPVKTVKIWHSICIYLSFVCFMPSTF